MAKIQNWTRVTCRNAGEVGMSGTVREWEHDATGERVSIRMVDPEDRPKRYDIRFHAPDEPLGEAVDAQSTLTNATASVVDTLRSCPNGLDIADGGA